MQSTKSNIFAGIISPQETAILAGAYKNSNYTPEYTAIFDKTKKALIQNGASEKEIKEIYGPVGLLLALGRQYTSEVNKKIAQKELNLKNGKPDKELDAELTNEYGEFSRIEKALTQIKDAYTYKDEFDKTINKRIRNNPKYYKDISIVKKDGTSELITAQGLINKYPLEIENSDGKKTKTEYPIGLMESYIDGTLEWKIDEKKTEANYRAKYEDELDNQGFISSFFTKKDKKDDKDDKSKTKYNSYYAIDPETKIKYDITEIVKDFGLPKTLAANLNKIFDTDASLIPASLQKTFRQRTGEMGRTISWTSSVKDETDYADKLANDIGQNLSNYMIQKGDAFKIITDDPELAETLNSGVISQIKSTPIKGLTAVKYRPIGSLDPSKRNITLVYDQEILLGANAKDDKYKDWDGSITFEVRSDAEIPGIPKAASGSYYDFILSNNPKGIKQEKIDEQFGLKFQFYKDQNNQIQYKAGYQTVIEDKESKVLSYVWKSVDVNSGTSGPYVENGGFSVLPSNLTVEDVIERLRQIMYSSIIPSNNTTIQKHYPSPTPVSIADQKMMDELNKSNTNILNQYK